jgi:3-phytase
MFIRSLLILSYLVISVQAQTILPKVTEFKDNGASDQDDMCIWIGEPVSTSLVIASDKAAKKIFVYDLQGNTTQTLNMPNKPRNIDVRYNFVLSGQLVDIVGVGVDLQDIYFYKITPATQQLEFIGSFKSTMSDVYGLALYHSKIDGRFYAFVSQNGSSGNNIEQWEIVDNGDGTVGGILVRTWVNGSGNGKLTEGLVADDETGMFYAAAEDEAIYKYDAEPTVANPTPTLVTSVGENGLVDDIEGIALYFAANGEGYLIASSQGNSTFKVYDRKPPHAFVTTFEVESTGGTDGIDVSNINFGGSYSTGIMLVHNDSFIYGSPFGNIGIPIDTTYWNPRYSVDTIAPAAIDALNVSTDPSDSRYVIVSWDPASTGDDITFGDITGFEVRWADELSGPIDTEPEWNNAQVAYTGSTQEFKNSSLRLNMSNFPAGNKYFAIRAFDEINQWSPLGAGSYSTSADYSLPVMLQNFDLTLENHAIIIKWSTASEINNEGFFLYRAKEGNDLHWQLLNQEIIAGQGNSNVRHEYEFIDAGIIEGQSYIYLLKSRDLTGQLHTLGQLRSSDLQSEQAQQTFELVQNFPNPFNNRTHFRFTLPEKGLVSLEVYDVLGRLVKRIINNKTLEASTYQQFSWDGTGDTGQSVSSGIYLYVLSFRSSATGIRQISTGKMVFIK